jgi:transglutaminase-like putative cysteine protease
VELDLQPEREGFDRYLEDTIVVDWQTPVVFEKAKTLCEGIAAESDRARVLFEFVRDEIDHSFDIETDVVTCNASQVLREGTGLCYAKSHLYVALLRARGLPAGFCYQRVCRDEASARLVLHGFVAVYLSERECWLAADPRGDNASVQTVFDVEAPSLAYHPDPELGEETIPIIFARPNKQVVDLLDYADSLGRIRAHLPGALTV